MIGFRGHLNTPSLDISVSCDDPSGPIEWLGVVWTEKEQREGIVKTAYPAPVPEQLKWAQSYRDKNKYELIGFKCRKDEE